MTDKKPAVSPHEDNGSNLLRESRRTSFEEGIHYEIKVKDHLGEHWSECLGDLRITHDAQGNSLLLGVVPDQAALHGILAQIRDLGLTLISLARIEKESHIEYRR